MGSQIPIAHLRREYSLIGLRKKDLETDPFKQFQKWLKEALNAQPLEPNAMTLATADKEGRPSARTVLLKEFNAQGFVFFTNYESRKAKDLKENPHAALVFYWPTLERQVCVQGTVSKVSIEESKIYFDSRPLESRLAAWASQQSSVIPNREVLEKKLEYFSHHYSNQSVPIPPHWGGFILRPSTIEFWQGRPNRLHDRFRYQKKTDNQWIIERLSP